MSYIPYTKLNSADELIEGNTYLMVYAGQPDVWFKFEVNKKTPPVLLLDFYSSLSSTTFDTMEAAVDATDKIAPSVWSMTDVEDGITKGYLELYELEQPRLPEEDYFIKLSQEDEPPYKQVDSIDELIPGRDYLCKETASNLWIKVKITEVTDTNIMEAVYETADLEVYIDWETAETASTLQTPYSLNRSGLADMIRANRYIYYDLSQPIYQRLPEEDYFIKLSQGKTDEELVKARAKDYGNMAVSPPQGAPEIGTKVTKNAISPYISAEPNMIVVGYIQSGVDIYETWVVLKHEGQEAESYNDFVVMNIGDITVDELPRLPEEDYFIKHSEQEQEEFNPDIIPYRRIRNVDEIKVGKKYLVLEGERPWEIYVDEIKETTDTEFKSSSRTYSYLEYIEDVINQKDLPAVRGEIYQLNKQEVAIWIAIGYGKSSERGWAPWYVYDLSQPTTQRLPEEDYFTKHSQEDEPPYELISYKDLIALPKSEFPLDVLQRTPEDEYTRMRLWYEEGQLYYAWMTEDDRLDNMVEDWQEALKQNTLSVKHSVTLGYTGWVSKHRFYRLDKPTLQRLPEEDYFIKTSLTQSELINTENVEAFSTLSTPSTKEYPVDSKVKVLNTVGVTISPNTLPDTYPYRIEPDKYVYVKLANGKVGGWAPHHIAKIAQDEPPYEEISYEDMIALPKSEFPLDVLQRTKGNEYTRMRLWYEGNSLISSYMTSQGRVNNLVKDWRDAVAQDTLSTSMGVEGYESWFKKMRFYRLDKPYRLPEEDYFTKHASHEIPPYKRIESVRGLRDNTEYLAYECNLGGAPPWMRIVMHIPYSDADVYEEDWYRINGNAVFSSYEEALKATERLDAADSNTYLYLNRQITSGEWEYYDLSQPIYDRLPVNIDF